jgi:hypothetical protein
LLAEQWLEGAAIKDVLRRVLQARWLGASWQCECSTGTRGGVHEHKRYGAGDSPGPQQAGLLVNYKRKEWLYQKAKLQVPRCKRKKVSATD